LLACPTAADDDDALCSGGALGFGFVGMVRMAGVYGICWVEVEVVASMSTVMSWVGLNGGGAGACLAGCTVQQWSLARVSLAGGARVGQRVEFPVPVRWLRRPRSAAGCADRMDGGMFHVHTPLAERGGSRSCCCLVQTKALFSSQKFSRFSVTSNLWSYAWSIKYR